MSIFKDGGPAFPMQDQQAIHAWAQAKIELLGLATTAERDAAYIQARAEAVGGMSLRDYLAAKAMQGLLARQFTKDERGRPFVEWVADFSFEMADAMLSAREKGGA